jgi:DNA-binding response OmpR family regulator
MHLLLVEDDLMLGEALVAGLTQDHYHVEWARNGQQALDRLRHHIHLFHAVILDLGLPDISGLHVLRELRQQTRTLPVLILTARETVRDRITGLDAGADDYLIKPIDLDELAARLRACTRRSHAQTAEWLQHGDLEVDLQAHLVRRAGQNIELSTQEFVVLSLFVKAPGRVMSRNQIEDHLYAWGGGSESNVLEVIIHRLRRKIGAQSIRTVRGIGYVMDPMT